MFVLHTSNKTENLLSHLDKVLETPLSTPFLKEQFLIQSQGMQRWLCQQLAEKKGVWANFEFHFPGKFFGRLVDEINKGDDAHCLNQDFFSQEFLVWHFDSLLRDFKGDVGAEFAVLQHYMQGDNADLKRYQLAEKLAYLFDQYQFMRPDWLASWEQGRRAQTGGFGNANLQSDEERWQRRLWQLLKATSEDIGDIGGSNKHDILSKGQLWLSVIERLSKMDKKQAESLGLLPEFLPERLCIFGINGMSPIYLRFLEVIGKFSDVHLFLLNPAEGYWADIATKKQLAKQVTAIASQNNHDNPLGLNNPNDQGWLEKIDNPLLSSLGQQGRDFQQLLLEQTDFELKFVSFEADESGTVLGQVKKDIVNNCIGKKRLTIDNSLSFHACHSRMRETEVLKDQILKSLDEDESLTIRDIVVMTPDISQYAPYISAVFEDIPHAVADKNMLDSNDPLSVFLRFLSLSQHRWELESVLEVLEQQFVYQKFGLYETDLEIIRTWIDKTHIRWGESASHRQELGFAAFEENSWQAGLNRLLMGYANADDSQFCDDILPFAQIEGTQAQALGCLVEFFTLLGKAKKTFGNTHTLKFWVEHLSYFTERLIDSTGDYQHQYSSLMTLISELQTYQSIHQEKISLDVILAWFTTQANNQQSGAGFLRGQLTFCSMLPMRAIPFKVIALMGMNEGEYPRTENRPAFDLMAHDFRKGDKSPRVDERYQFLEVLLSAQQQLIITYIGQSLKTNETIPSSVVVAELLEVLGEYYGLKQEAILTLHALQPHSRRYFSDLDSLYSYSSNHYAVSHALANQQAKGDKEQEKQHWWQGSIALSTESEQSNHHHQQQLINLTDLIDFYRHPQGHFIRNQLQIRIPSIETRADETEPFALKGLMQYQIEQEWVERLVEAGAGEVNTLETDDNDEAFYQRLMAQGRWLSGENGRIAFDEHREEIAAFVESIKSKIVGEKLEPFAVDIKVGEHRIIGSLMGILRLNNKQSRVIYRYAKLKGKDLLPAWIEHLVALQLEQDTETWLLTKDEEWNFQSVDNSEHILLGLVQHYIEGQQAPSPLVVEPAFAWQTQHYSPKGRLTPLQKASNVYQGVLAYDADLQLLYKNLPVDAVINMEFEAACSLISPAWHHRVIGQ